jgi:hypothetical protein
MLFLTLALMVDTSIGVDSIGFDADPNTVRGSKVEPEKQIKWQVCAANI